MNEDIKRQKTIDFVRTCQKSEDACPSKLFTDQRSSFNEKLAISDIINQFLKIGVKEVLVFDNNGAAVFKEKIN